LPRGLANNSHTNCGQPDEHGCRQRPQPQQPKASRRPFRSRVVHPCAKNSEISWAEIAPSRMMRQRASSSVRSTMVEGISRGEVPPSTIMEIRPFSCSRTASAVVHSFSPLRLAEVRSLEFEEPRYDVFPALNLARKAGEAGGVLPAILNAANEVAVQAFLDDQIPFPEIWRLVHSAMEYNANLASPSLDDIIRADSEARLFVRRALGILSL